MNEDPLEVARQARDITRALFLALIDEGIVPPDKAARILEPIIECVAPDEQRALQEEVARAVVLRASPA